jgi:hypothetical protein
VVSQAVLLELASLQALAWCLPGTCMQGGALAGHDAAQGQQPGWRLQRPPHPWVGASLRGIARQGLLCIRTAYRASLMVLVVTVRWLVGDKVTGASAAHSRAMPQAACCLHAVLAWEGGLCRGAAAVQSLLRCRVWWLWWPVRCASMHCWLPQRCALYACSHTHFRSPDA